MRWILLRGLMRERRHWENFPEQLRLTFPQAEVHALDLLGNGSLSHLSSPTQICATVEALRHNLKQAEIAPPYHVLALSLGAMVALSWMQTNPEEVQAGVLLNTSVRGLNPFYERLRPAVYWGVLQNLLTQPDRWEKEYQILQRTSNLRTDLSDLAGRWAGYARQSPVSSTNLFRQLCAAAQFEAPRESPRSPVLVLAGLGDRLVSPACSQKLAQRYGWPCLLHPKAGHDLTLDAGDWVTHTLASWVNAGYPLNWNPSPTL